MPEIKDFPNDVALVDSDVLPGQRADGTPLKATVARIKEAVNGAGGADITRNTVTANVQFRAVAAAGSEALNVLYDGHGSVAGAHTFEIRSGIPNRFASQADHSHLKMWVTNPAGPAAGTAGSRAQLLYSGFTNGTNTLNLHGYGPEVGLAIVANEDSLDTTGTNATLTGAPDYRGVIKIRYTTAPSLSLNQLVIFNVSSAVAGIQASLYGGKVTQLPTLVSGKFETLVQISGLDPNHWNAANAGDVGDLDGNWDLRTLTQPEIASGNKVSIARDTAGPTDQLTITWGAAHNLTLGQSVNVWADVGISGITGLIVGGFNSGHVVEVVSSTAAKVRVRNSRLHTIRSFTGTNSTPSQWAVYPGVRDPHHEPLPPHNALTAWRDSEGRTRRLAIGGADVLPTADLSAAIGFDLPPVTRPNTVRIGVGKQFVDVLDSRVSRSNSSLITAQSPGLIFESTNPCELRAPLTGQAIGEGDLTAWARLRIPNSVTPVGEGRILLGLTEGNIRILLYSEANDGLYLSVDTGTGVYFNHTVTIPFDSIWGGKIVDLCFTRKGTTVKVYINGTEYSSLTNAKCAGSFSGAANLRIGQPTTNFAFIGRAHKLALFNREFTEAEIEELIDFDVNVDERLGSVANLVTNTGFESNTSGYSVAATGVATLTRITSDFNSGAACAEFSGTVAGDAFHTDFASSPQGVRYRVTFWAKLISGNPNITVSRGNGRNQVPVTLTGSWAKYVVETDKTAGALAQIARWNLTGATVFRIDDIQVEQLGSVVDLDCGVGAGVQIPDRTANKLHAVAIGLVTTTPAVRHLIPARRGQVRARITATGQVLSTSGTTLLPANTRITSIVANVVGSGTVSLGTTSLGTQVVNAASVAAGLNDLAVATRLFANNTGLWATLTGPTQVDFTISYELID